MNSQSSDNFRASLDFATSAIYDDRIIMMVINLFNHPVAEPGFLRGGS